MDKMVISLRENRGFNWIKNNTILDYSNKSNISTVSPAFIVAPFKTR